VAEDEIWEVHGSTWVVKHKALERIAAEQGIVGTSRNSRSATWRRALSRFSSGGKLGDHVEYSFGEASPKNNKNSYPIAMAEKRSKDRVILKLLAVHGDLYSEEEADDFKRQNPHVTRAADIVPPPNTTSTARSSTTFRTRTRRRQEASRGRSAPDLRGPAEGNPFDWDRAGTSGMGDGEQGPARLA
jgi:hypothetical protein